MKRIAFALCAVFALLGQAKAQTSEPFHVLSAASDNAQVVVLGSSQMNALIVINTTATLYYLKFYDTATTPTCGTTPVKWSFPVPFGTSSAGGGLAPPLPPEGVKFNLGIGICLTGGLADNDDTSAATGVAINIGVKR